jgi:hypothetical protein
MAYDMNGSGARLTCNGISGLNVGTGDFSFTCRVNSRNVNGIGLNSQRGFVQISTTSGGLSTSYTTGIIGVFGIGAASGYDGGMAFNVGNTWVGVNSVSVTTNTYYLLSCVRSSGTVATFVDTTQIASASAAGSLTGENICIGGYYDTTYTLVGAIADVAYWNVAISAAEVASLTRGFTPDQIRPQSLQFYAPLVRDLSDVRGGRTITNVNTATVASHPRIIT